MLLVRGVILILAVFAVLMILRSIRGVPRR